MGHTQACLTVEVSQHVHHAHIQQETIQIKICSGKQVNTRFKSPFICPHGQSCGHVQFSGFLYDAETLSVRHSYHFDNVLYCLFHATYYTCFIKKPNTCTYKVDGFLIKTTSISPHPSSASLIMKMVKAMYTTLKQLQHVMQLYPKR